MNLLIYGKRRQGKSTLALALAVGLHERVVIFDPNDQFPLIQSYDMEQLRIHLAGKFVQRGNGRTFMFARVGPFNTDEVATRFEEFSELIQEQHGISVVVDEAHMLQGANWLDPSLDRWNRRSPADVAVIQTTHRIVDAHPDSRYHADHVFFFYAYLPRELKTIRENFGDDVAVEVPKLKQYQLIHWTKAPGGIPQWELWPDGREWYIDLENENA